MKQTEYKIKIAYGSKFQEKIWKPILDRLFKDNLRQLKYVNKKTRIWVNEREL